MRIYGLVGKSGTGKSYQATNLSRRLNIEAIIDDGLYILHGSIMAGISAKRQNTTISAIKTALFTDEAHYSTVAAKIKETQPESILVLGTSNKMVKKIAERLELPDFEEIVYIESITTDEERETARIQRHELGKHVIPVPTLQLKREFSGYFMDPLRIFKGWRGGRASFSEKTVVRPTYSYLGDYSISDKVIGDIVLYIGKQVEGVDSVLRIMAKSNAQGVHITIPLIVKFGYKVFDVAKEMQQKTAGQVALMTAFHIDGVDVEIRGLR